MKSVGQRYFNKAYWRDGTRSGYTEAGYDRYNYLNQAKAAYFKVLFSDRLSGEWLEVGCAFGWVVDNLLDLEIDAFGFDISKYAIKHAPEEIRYRLKCSDGLNATLYNEERFDVIVSFETAEHVPMLNVGTWLYNLASWLKPGGELFLTICLGNDNNRGLNDIDESHQTLQPREWWEDRLSEKGLVKNEERFKRASEIVIDVPTGRENIITDYDMYVFCWRKPVGN